MEGKEIFDALFNEVDTYAIIPEMLAKVSHDVTRSEFDSLKCHSVAYHISGMIDVLLALKKALEDLEFEAFILGIDLENEIDKEQMKKYKTIKCLFEEIDKIIPKEPCVHIGTEVIETLGNGYFKLKCEKCGEHFIDG